MSRLPLAVIRKSRPSAGCVLVAVLAASIGWPPVPAAAQTLRGSYRSIEQQNQEAARHGFTYLRSSRDVRNFVEQGFLVPVTESPSVHLKEVSFPFARPEVRTFVERLGAQYQAACDDVLVVTSLTRPTSRQPRNASPRSVHPTGMALDLRRPWRTSCRRWLESTLLYLEYKNVLEATYERTPPHYHVALFPRSYAEYLARAADDDLRDEHLVTRGDTLDLIARRYATTVTQVQRINGLRSHLIYPGQVLKVPTGR